MFRHPFLYLLFFVSFPFRFVFSPCVSFPFPSFAWLTPYHLFFFPSLILVYINVLPSISLSLPFLYLSFPFILFPSFTFRLTTDHFFSSSLLLVYIYVSSSISSSLLFLYLSFPFILFTSFPFRLNTYHSLYSRLVSCILMFHHQSLFPFPLFSFLSFPFLFLSSPFLPYPSDHLPFFIFSLILLYINVPLTFSSPSSAHTGNLPTCYLSPGRYFSHL